MKNFLMSLPSEFRARLNTIDVCRNTAIDIMRCLCILYIVGFFHLWDYAVAAPEQVNIFTNSLCLTVLGLFVLISGYLIGGKDIALTKSDICKFYISRVLRIYPPFILAILSFALIGISDQISLIKSIPLLSMIYGPAPSTLWFIVMLFNYYLLAPFLIAARQNSFIKYLCVSVIIFLTLITLCVLVEKADMRLALYFPAFSCGIFFARNEQILYGKNRFLLAILAMASLLLLQFNIASIERSLTTIPFIMFSSLFIFATMMRNQSYFFPNLAIAFISTASYFMYLFHRPVYAVASHFFLPDNPVFQVIFLIGVCLPVLIVFSWIGQTSLDAVTRCLKFNRS